MSVVTDVPRGQASDVTLGRFLRCGNNAVTSGDAMPYMTMLLVVTQWQVFSE